MEEGDDHIKDSWGCGRYHVAFALRIDRLTVNRLSVSWWGHKTNENTTGNQWENLPVAHLPFTSFSTFFSPQILERNVKRLEQTRRPVTSYKTIHLQDGQEPKIEKLLQESQDDEDIEWKDEEIAL